MSTGETDTPATIAARKSAADAARRARIAELAAVTAERDEALKYGAPVAGAKALSFVKNPCKRHNEYWTTAYGNCMACRADAAESALAAREAEVGRLRCFIQDAMEYANGHWDEWGMRAEKTRDILETALTPPTNTEKPNV